MRGYNILRVISKLGMVNRCQIQILCRTGGKRSTNITIKKIIDYVDHVYKADGRIYKLNKKGINFLGEGEFINWGNVNHRILTNDIYIKYMPTTWKSEPEVSVGGVKINPDAYFYSGMTYKFLEVDRTQRWYKNIDKLDRYRDLKATNQFQKRDGRFPLLIWVVEIESRLPKIKKECNKRGIECEVFTSKFLKQVIYNQLQERGV